MTHSHTLTTTRTPTLTLTLTAGVEERDEDDVESGRVPHSVDHVLAIVGCSFEIVIENGHVVLGLDKSDDCRRFEIVHGRIAVGYRTAFGTCPDCP